jgi:hypothetical protein
MRPMACSAPDRLRVGPVADAAAVGQTELSASVGQTPPSWWATGSAAWSRSTSRTAIPISCPASCCSAQPLHRGQSAAFDHLTGLGGPVGWLITESPFHWLGHGVLGRLHPAVAALARPDLPGTIAADALGSDWRVQRIDACLGIIRSACARDTRRSSLPGRTR